MDCENIYALTERFLSPETFKEVESRARQEGLKGAFQHMIEELVKKIKTGALTEEALVSVCHMICADVDEVLEAVSKQMKSAS